VVHEVLAEVFLALRSGWGGSGRGHERGRCCQREEQQETEAKSTEYLYPGITAQKVHLVGHGSGFIVNCLEQLRQILLLAVNTGSKYFAIVKNRFLLIKCISLGAFSFPTPFFIFFFLTNVDPNEISYKNRFLLISMLFLGGALIGMASYYKDSAVAVLKDWYPSEKP
jgi:hypothetical protein